jgi:hypothetical protein
MEQEQSAEADRNRVIKECLNDAAKLEQLNQTMAATIANEVYDSSLARVMLLPRLIPKDSCPIFADGENGPVVVVNMVQDETRVLKCRAFRDSLREEEEVRTVRDIDFVVMRGQGVRPPSFPLSNVCTLRLPELNGHAFSMVERARAKLKHSLATDETRVALRALSWVCAKFGHITWSRSFKTMDKKIKTAIERIGLDRHPAVICSPTGFAGGLSTRLFKSMGIPTMDKPNAPLAGIPVEGGMVPVYVNQSLDNHVLYIIPSGESLGQMPIFIAPNIVDYDKKERLIKGWLLYQEQGMVFVNVKLTNGLFIGARGLVEAGKCWLGRVLN